MMDLLEEEEYTPPPPSFVLTTNPEVINRMRELAALHDDDELRWRADHLERAMSEFFRDWPLISAVVFAAVTAGCARALERVTGEDRGPTPPPEYFERMRVVALAFHRPQPEGMRLQ